MLLSAQLLSGDTDQGNGMLSDDATSLDWPFRYDENIGSEPELGKGDDKEVGLLSQSPYTVGSEGSRSGTQFPVFYLLS
ncbi:hypothetical protein U1Q18_029233 [Sarracenia purpurea var. burkii]